MNKDGFVSKSELVKCLNETFEDTDYDLLSNKIFKIIDFENTGKID